MAHLATLDVRKRPQWRKWLEAHHDSASEIWLVFHKRHTREECISYDDAVEEALCFGWIDSIVRRLDDERYARKFTPRKPGSRWSTSNRQRYAKLEQRGLLAQPGRKRVPTERSGDAPRPSVSVLPSYIEKPLKADARAWDISSSWHHPTGANTSLGSIRPSERRPGGDGFAKQSACWRLVRSSG